MKNVKLIIDGKEIEVLISEENLEKLTDKRATGYEKARYDSTYYTDSCGVVKTFVECTENSEFDEEVYKSGNYYSDPDVAANNIRADNLMRQLRRFAVESRKSDIDWNDETQYKYFIYYYYGPDELRIQSVSSCSFRDFGQIYFDTKETAELAIEKFKDELLWYFTEYRDSL